MFNRSKKYILLLLLNITVVIVWYSKQDTNEVGVFETEYVIDLLDQRDRLQQTIDELEITLRSNELEVIETRKMIEEVQVNAIRAQQQSNKCEAERIDLVAAVESANAQASSSKTTSNAASCAVQNRQIATLNQQLSTSQNRLDELIEENAILKSDLIITEQAQQSTSSKAEVDALKAKIQQLEKDIEDPIYLKSLLVSERRCEQPRFDGIVCLQEFLVRPKFSKAPLTEVEVNIYNPSNSLVANATFISKRAQLMRLSLGRGQELPTGNYKAEFLVNGEILTESHLIARK